MIQIDTLAYIPKLNYAEYAWKELCMSRVALRSVEMTSDGIWGVSVDGVPIVIVGVARPSLTSVPRFWFLMCKNFVEGSVNFHLRSLKAAIVLLDARYPRLETLVEEGWVTGDRFARFGGFRPTERRQTMYKRNFRVWEK